MSHRAFRVIDWARTDLESWANDRQIPLHKLEFVATFEKWTKWLGVLVFYESREQVEKYSEDGTSEQLQREFLSLLKKHGYPFDEFPEVIFDFDSHQEVVENYGGSYFRRMR